MPLAEGRLEIVQRGAGFLLVLAVGAPEPGDLATAHRTDAGPSLLVRPDGYVAWAGEARRQGWRRVLEGWLGSPSAQAASASS